MTKLNKIWQYLKSFDYILIFAILTLFVVNIFVQYSANDGNLTRVYSDISYLFMSLLVMFAIAHVNINKIKSISIPLYIISLVLIALVLVIGVKVNGARRWLNLGIRIQPSEICKLSVPLMVAYILSTKDQILKAKDYVIAFLYILVPFLIVAKQPDLGTGILIFSSGFFVLFIAGLSWRIIIGSILLIITSSPLIWHMLRDYQKTRILTLIDPQSDPLGAGYHIIQGLIAIGSGGFWGKGYMHGTQIHLSFIPEKHTDFVITVIAEEFGYVGVVCLLAIYFVIALRGLRIMRLASDRFTQTLAGSIILSFILYVLINMGMVGGVFPVVGVPLPLVSYGGTASIVLMIGFGILLSINRQRLYS